jgi:hypothetical protein
MSVYLILNRIVMFSWLLPVPFLIKHRQPAAFRWLVICQLISFSTELLSSLGVYFLKINPNYIINPMYVVSLIWISSFFYNAIGWKSLQFSIVIINVFFLLFGLANILFIQRMSPNYYTMTIENLLILGFCILFYYKMLKELPSIQVQKDPLFLIVSGWFFTFAGQVVLTLVSTYMLSILNDNMEVLWIMFLILNMLGNFIKALGAYFQFKLMKRSTAEPARA